jgi:hypothetical protein
MTIREFEHGKIQVMAAARDALRKIGLEYHCVSFDVHGSQQPPAGVTLTAAVDGNAVTSWFSADEILASCSTVRSDVHQKIAKLVVGLREPVTG